MFLSSITIDMRQSSAFVRLVDSKPGFKFEFVVAAVVVVVLLDLK